MYKNTHLGLVLAVLLVVSVFTVAGVLLSSRLIHNTGSVKAVGVGVYWNSTCTNNVTLIDWGVIGPGEKANRTVYIRNEGNSPVVLNMTTSGWNPQSAQSYIALSWNREGYLLGVGAVVKTVLTVSVSQSISGILNFSFDIVVTGKGT